MNQNLLELSIKFGMKQNTDKEESESHQNR